MRHFLDAVAGQPGTWRVIPLPLEGTPAIVRDHVETNRARTVEQVQALVRWAIERSALPSELDAELAARAMQSLAEEAARMVLTDAASYSPERCEAFVRTVLGALGAAGQHDGP